MNALAQLIPGLVSAFAVVLAIRGYRMMRTDPAELLTSEDLVLLKAAERERVSGRSALDRAGHALGQRLVHVLPGSVYRWLQRQVDLAGRPDGMGVESLLAGSMKWLILISPAVLLFLMQGRFLFVLLSFAIIVVLPLAKLSGTARKRCEQIDSDLPDFMDVLAVTVSAGVGFRAALATVARRFGGPLAEEIELSLHQMNNGASLRSAFLSLRSRTDSESVDEFVSAYLQSEELGAPLADTLNQIAGDMRLATAQRLRQKAAKVEPRATLIVTIVMVPGAIILLAGGLFLALGGEDLGSIFGG